MERVDGAAYTGSDEGSVPKVEDAPAVKYDVFEGLAERPKHENAGAALNALEVDRIIEYVKVAAIKKKSRVFGMEFKQ